MMRQGNCKLFVKSIVMGEISEDKYPFGLNHGKILTDSTPFKNHITPTLSNIFWDSDDKWITYSYKEKLNENYDYAFQNIPNDMLLSMLYKLR